MAQPGPPTLKHVAELAGVHIATASRALSDDRAHLVGDATRQRVREAADSLDYRGNALARSLRTGATGTIGFVVADLENPFVVAVLRGIEEECRPLGCMPVVAETHDDPQRLRSVVSRLLLNRVDAIIMSAARLADEEFILELESRLPVVLAVRGLAAAPAGASAAPGVARHREVLPDDVRGARMATEHLLGLGHRRLAELPGTPEISSFAERSAGFRAALAAHPGTTDLTRADHAALSTVAEGRRLAAVLLAAPAGRRPTALLAHNDQMAVGALDAVHEAGLRCPEDVSIVGFNDVPLIDHLDPPLTTIRLPGLDVGRRSARLTFQALAGEAPPRTRTVLAPHLVVRASTSRPLQRT
ncbi:LacI family DNA-binding transcriptional regulator [Herbiconiux solani]|uniref:LacI family DNA-binding transcriptional regulator n=1 Tax=Herbiconiux solani TaxID=661329 RepID=UPI0008270B4F|nr:LacI family DNA-binding transcriptional regulator [Herbiconiux solani]